jgi:hypothetical protein
MAGAMEMAQMNPYSRYYVKDPIRMADLKSTGGARHPRHRRRARPGRTVLRAVRPPSDHCSEVDRGIHPPGDPGRWRLRRESDVDPNGLGSPAAEGGSQARLGQRPCVVKGVDRTWPHGHNRGGRRPRGEDSADSQGDRARVRYGGWE